MKNCKNVFVSVCFKPQLSFTIYKQRNPKFTELLTLKLLSNTSFCTPETLDKDKFCPNVLFIISYYHIKQIPVFWCDKTPAAVTEISFFHIDHHLHVDGYYTTLGFSE